MPETLVLGVLYEDPTDLSRDGSLALSILTFEEPTVIGPEDFPEAVGFVDPYTTSVYIDLEDKRAEPWKTFFSEFGISVLNQAQAQADELAKAFSESFAEQEHDADNV